MSEIQSISEHPKNQTNKSHSKERGKNQKVFLILIILVGIAFLSLANALVITGALNTFNLTKTSYAPGELLQGTMNISLRDELIDSIVKTSLINFQTKLIDFLNNTDLVAGKDYICNPASCGSFYDVRGTPEKIKTIMSKIVGPMVVGKNLEIKPQALTFNVSAAETSSLIFTSSPVKIDLLNDGTIDWMYLDASDSFAAKLYSPCYTEVNATRDFLIDANGFCQKINLPESSKFKINALVRKTGTAEGNLYVSLYDKEADYASDWCDMPEPTSTTYSEISCIADFTSTGDGEYYVCIKDTESDYAYKIKGETTDEKISKEACPGGYRGLPQDASSDKADVAISVNAAYIAPFTKTLVFNSEEFDKTHSGTLREYLQDYISNKYGNDCITNKCIIPINITSKISIRISNLDIAYCSGSLCETTEYMYDVVTSNAKIKMNYTMLPIQAANLSAPKTPANYTARVFIGDKEIGTAEITVEKVPIVVAITPKIIPAATPTIIIALVNSTFNVTKFEWTFGDDSSETTTSNTVSHTYTSTGTFKISVKVTDIRDKSSTSYFTVIAGSPKDMINSSITQKTKQVDDFVSTLNSYPDWEIPIIKQVAGIDGIKATINTAKTSFSTATTEEEYLQIMSTLSSLSIPVTISAVSTTSEFEYPVDPNKVDPDLVSKAGAGSYDPEKTDEVRNAIAGWATDNLNIKLQGTVFDIKKEDKTDDYVSVINLKVNPKTSINDSFLIILADYQKTKFADNYNQKNIDGYIAITLKSGNFEFAIPGRIDLSDFDLFISPNFEDLGAGIVIECNDNGICESDLGENYKNCRVDCKPIGIGIFLAIGLIVFVFILYLFLGWWYETKYESYLFKNRQDLANIILFVSNALNRGVDEKEMREKLKKAGWNGEQIEYAINKVKGKKMGMPALRRGIKKKQIELGRR
ncbi:PKD domain-containing protein [Candidatus Pacearchaeota archaeon]|nr:PKD domain-containing protein [Candidatus Pacearchaeota archaeon]